LITHGTTTSQSQTTNGHRVILYAISNEGQTISQKDLRDIQALLVAKGFSGNWVERSNNIIAKLGAMVFG